MGLKQFAKRIEKQHLRPFIRRFKRSHPHAGGGAPGSADRIEQLERRMEMLESLVREDLGLRYLEMDAKEGSEPASPAEGGS